MAFVLSRPPSPSMDIQHQGPSPLSHQYQDIDMAKDKEKTHIEIILDTPYIVLKGSGVDIESSQLSGHLVLYLTESTPIKEITLQFRGKARVPVSTSDSMALNTAPLTYIICTHDWSFLEGDKKSGRAHTLKAGRHIFPFQLRIGGSLPSTISTVTFGGASIAYKLRAHAVRSGFYQNLQAILPVPILRSFASEALEYQQTLEIENTWPEKLMYSIMVPHKAWAAGDKVTALVKFCPLAKGATVINVSTAIHEHTKIHGRSGHQETSRVVAVVRHEIVGSRAVEVENVRSGHLRGQSQSHSPASPGGSSPGFSPIHRNTSSTSAIGRHFSLTSNNTLSRPSSPPFPSQPSHSQEPDHPTPSTSDSANPPESADPENSDVVTYLSISLPPSLTPSHNLEPITVSHRIRWSILILNLDGHTSELRCSLPIHILDYRLLPEARAFSAATRRLLLGSSAPPVREEEEEGAQLPSYNAHVRDRVANMFLPDSATVRVTNPWIAQGASPTFHHDSPAPPWPLSRAAQAHSGHSTPLEAHPLSHLPHAPTSGTNTPLDWLNSELLLSLSDELPGTTSPSGHPHTPTPPTTDSNHSPPEPDAHAHNASGTRRRSRPSSRSRFSSRSRGTSESRERSRPLSLSNPFHSPIPVAGSGSGPTTHPVIDAAHIPVGGSAHETYVHNGHASRAVPGVFSAAMKPFSSFSPNHWIARHTHHTHHPPVHVPHPLAPPSQTGGGHAGYGNGNGGGGNGQVLTAPPVGDLQGSALLHRAFTEVPDYAVASRGFLGGVPPLEIMRGLPSYEETQRVQGGAGVGEARGSRNPEEGDASPELDVTRLQ